MPVVRANIARETEIVTDEARHYRDLKRDLLPRDRQPRCGGMGRWPVPHQHGEGYFSVFKRGIKGVYQHCSEKHLHRYLAEFDFSYSNRADLGVDDTSAPIARCAASKANASPIGGWSAQIETAG